MPAKRPKLDKNKRVKAMARTRLGSPKPARAIPDKTQRDKLKHKRNSISEVEAELE